MKKIDKKIITMILAFVTGATITISINSVKSTVIINNYYINN